MFIKVIRLVTRQYNNEKHYYLNEISLNTNHIAFITENSEMKSMLNEGKINLNLNNQAHFTDIKLSSGSVITVIGSASIIETKIAKSSKKILRG